MSADSFVSGGFDLLDPADRARMQQSEATEPRRFRPPDRLDDILRAVLKIDDLGLHVEHYQFRITSDEYRERDITFDRCYPKLTLLVHNFSRRMTYQKLEDKDVEAAVRNYAEFADSKGYTFLPILDGEVEPETMERVRLAVQAHLKPAHVEPNEDTEEE